MTSAAWNAQELSVSLTCKTAYFILIGSPLIYIAKQCKSPREHVQGSESMIQSEETVSCISSVAAGEQMALLPQNKPRKQN